MTTFKDNLKTTYDIISTKFNNIVITGSSALLCILLNNNLEIPSELLKPNDIDILVVQNTDITIKKIGSYISKQDISSSKTFSNGNNSFDIIKCSKVKYIKIDDMNIINPLSLLTMYKIDERDNDKIKIKILEKYREIFEHLECNEYNVKPKKEISYDISIRVLSFD